MQLQGSKIGNSVKFKVNLALGLLLLLGACSGLPGDTSSPEQQLDDQGTAAIRSGSVDAANEAQSIQQPEVASIQPLPMIAPGELMAYSREELTAALGLPVFGRTDKGSELLRFQGIDCVLDVFLYPDDTGPAGPDGKSSGGPTKIALVQARNDRGAAINMQACLDKTPRQRG